MRSSLPFVRIVSPALVEFEASWKGALPVLRGYLGPDAARRELVPVERIRPHLDAVAWDRRRHVAPVLHGYGIEEVLVQVVHVLEDSVLE